MELSKRAVATLEKAFNTDGCAFRFFEVYAASSRELVDANLAILTPHSQGGWTILLTAAGVAEAERRRLGMKES